MIKEQIIEIMTDAYLESHNSWVTDKKTITRHMENVLKSMEEANLVILEVHTDGVKQVDMTDHQIDINKYLSERLDKL